MRKSALVGLGLVVAALVALGLVVLFSAGGANGLRIHHDQYYFIRHQAVFVLVGLMVAAVMAAIDYRIWREHPFLCGAFYLVIFIALLAVFHYKPINGSYRWINLKIVSFQPSEFAKLATVIAVAVWMDRAGYRVEFFWRGVVGAVLLIAAYAVPIVLESDYGATIVVVLAGTLVMFVAGARLWHLLILCMIGGALGAGMVLHNPNRMARIMAWSGSSVSVGAEVSSTAAKRATDQARMSLVAIKNGGLFGVGIGQSMQKQYYLPEAHTDFIFAVGAEEMGLGFSIGTMVLFVIFLLISVHIARHAADRFGRYLTVGMAFIVFFQAMINLGVVCELLPTKGMALPFFSYGGTNIVSTLFAVGTIFSVGIHSRRDRKRTLLEKVVMRGR